MTKFYAAYDMLVEHHVIFQDINTVRVRPQGEHDYKIRNLIGNKRGIQITTKA